MPQRSKKYISVVHVNCFSVKDSQKISSRLRKMWVSTNVFSISVYKIGMDWQSW